MNRLSWFISIGIVAKMATNALAGGSYVHHDWQTNPETEHWSLKDDSDGSHRFLPSVEAMPGWKIDTKTNGGSGVGAYQFFNAPPAISRWAVQAHVKVISADPGGGQAIRVGNGKPMDGGTQTFGIQFSTAPDGDPIVSLEGSTFSMEIQGGVGKYHDYRLLIDDREHPVSDLWVNGVSVHLNYFGFGATLDGNPQRFEFGDLNPSASVNGDANWGYLDLIYALPEPDCMVTLMIGLASLLSGRQFRKCSSHCWMCTQTG